MAIATPVAVVDVWAHNDHQHFGARWDGWGRKVASMLPGDAGVVLDWGCGGGAVMRAMQNRCTEYFAVDVSPRARQACHDLGAHVMDPGEASRRPTPYVDTVVSAACFQHFPSKAYARDVLGVLRRSVRPGGCGLVQVRVDDEPRESAAPYGDRFIDGIAWTVSEFWSELARGGFSPQWVKLEDDYGFYVFRG